MMCDKCGSKSPDIELYCKNCGVDLQIFGRGGEKISIPSSAPADESAQPSAEMPASVPAPSFSESPFQPPPGAFPAPPSGAPSSPSPGSFGDLPGFPVPPPVSSDVPSASPPPAFQQAEGLSLSPRTVAPSTGKPLSDATDEQGNQGPVDFSFLGKPAEQKKEETQSPPPPESPPPAPGAFNPDFFKPKEGK